MRNVVIVGSATEQHAAAVADQVRARGAHVTIFDTRQFPEEIAISLGDALADVFVDGARLVPDAVYIRNLALNPAVQPDPDADADDLRREMLALRERVDVITSVIHRWEALGAAIYNPPSVRHRITKPYQLGLLAAAGLPVPESLWSNDPERVRAFAAGKRVAYKPVAGGAATRELVESDLTDDRLDLLAAAPVCFQELLPGTDIRVYVIDGEIVASVAILTDAIDFRQNEKSLEPYPIGDDLAAVCRRAADVLGLRFTGMDLKGDVRGVLKILELNPSPMFLGFDGAAGTDICGRLAAALAG